MDAETQENLDQIGRALDSTSEGLRGVSDALNRHDASLNESLSRIEGALKWHNQRSDERKDEVLKAISAYPNNPGYSHNPGHSVEKQEEGGTMSASEKVEVHLNGHSGDNQAAMIAALGNRNQGNDNAALIAALGNRNSGNDLAAIISAMGNRRDGDDGMNNLWPLLLLALFRGRGGIGGDDCGHDGVGPAQAVFNGTILDGINGLTAAVPTTALQTQAAINNSIASLALGTQQGFANVKDSVQNTAAVNLSATQNVGQSVLTTGLQTQIAIGMDGDKTRALIQGINEANLQRQLAVAENALAEERTRARTRDVEVNVSQVVTQAQAQAQQQAQIQGLHDLVRTCVGELQVARATNANLIIGSTGVATGAQTANPVNVR